MTGKGNPSNKPKLANLGEIDLVTNETNVPVTYFAGARKINVSWVMQPVIAFTRPSDTSGKGK